MVPMESCSVVEWLRQIPKQIQYYNKRQAGLTETDLYRNRGKPDSLGYYYYYYQIQCKTINV